ncbi:MAG: pentapeptide repeat-containing protein, partial [Byssovorax sp.]
EIPLACDLVWLFPEAGMGAVVFHGSMRIAEDDAADVVHLVCACEEPEAPRPIEHYRSVLARRLDKDKGAIAGLSDSDLMPGRASGVVANLGGLEIGRWVRSEQLVAKNLRRWQERHLAESRARAEEAGLDPNDLGDLPPEPDLPPVDDLDAIAAYVETQLPKASEVTRQIDEKEAEAREKARAAFAEMGKDYDEVMAEGVKEGSGPPRFSAAAQIAKMEEIAQGSREEGIPLVELEQHIANPAFRADLEKQERSFAEMYRRHAHHQPTAAAMDAESSARVRVLVLLAQESGESLAKRDFTGASLAGMKLSGIDLSGALLEAADLSGCDLSRANLAGAVLAKANLRGADLRYAELAGANLGGAILQDAVLDRADLKDSVLHGAKLTGARFTDAELSSVHWMDVEVGGLDLSGAVLTKALFVRTNLGGVRFVGADLSEATFVECRLDGADFSRATLRKASFITCAGEGVSFREARFRQGVVVHGSSLPKADFRDADLEKANLRGTVLTAARFDRAHLDGADLSA